MSDAQAPIERERALVVAGSVVGRYHVDPASPRYAEHFVSAGSAAAASDAVIATMSGWNLSTADAALVTALQTRGATVTRRYAFLSISLREVRVPRPEHPMPGGLTAATLTPDTEVTPGLVTLVQRAYPPGHPDHEAASDHQVRADTDRLLRGQALGPLLPVSRIALDAGRPVGLVIVNRVPGTAPTAGLWLTDLCRDPDPAYAGLGRHLLREVLADCADAGEEAMSLAVTDGNPARSLYESLGFAVAVAGMHTVRLPG